MIRHLAAVLGSIGLALSPQATAGAEPAGNYFQVVFDVTNEIAPGFERGFGYAVYVNFQGKRLLFDTGADADVLRHNLARAGIDPEALDAVAISHNHFDHATGLSHVRKVRPDLSVYVPPGQDYDDGKLTRLEDFVALGPNLYLLRTHTNRPTVGISDELSVLIRTANGPYLITACSHTSVATIVDRAAEIAGADIFYYTGGARLKFRGAGDAAAVAGNLKARRVAHVSPGHCSVDHGVGKVFEAEFPDGYVASKLGERVPLPPPG